MISNIKVNQRESGAIVTIELPNGTEFRITVNDKADNITINTADKALLVKPYQSNEIQIHATY